MDNKNDEDESGFLEAPFVRMLRMRSASLKKSMVHTLQVFILTIIISHNLIQGRFITNQVCMMISKNLSKSKNPIQPSLELAL